MADEQPDDTFFGAGVRRYCIGLASLILRKIAIPIDKTTPKMVVTIRARGRGEVFIFRFSGYQPGDQVEARRTWEAEQGRILQATDHWIDPATQDHIWEYREVF